MADLILLLNWLAALVLVAAAVLIMAGVASGTIGALTWAIRLGTLLWVPTPTGVRPVDRRAVAAAGTRLVDQAEQVAALRASHAPVPHILHQHGSGGASTVVERPGLLAGPATQDAGAPLPERVDLLASLTAHPCRPGDVRLGIGPRGPIDRLFGPETIHPGIVAGTGAGKSAIMQALAYQIATNPQRLPAGEARSVVMHWLDLEGRTSQPFRHCPVVDAIADDPESAAALLKSLLALVNERARLGEEQVARLPLHVLMVEEMWDLQRDLARTAWDDLVRLAIRARKADLWLVMASQVMYSTDETRTLRGQLRTRLLGGVEDPGVGRAFGFSPADLVLLRQQQRDGATATPGRFLLRTPSGVTPLQAGYVAPDIIEASWRTRPVTTMVRPTHVAIERGDDGDVSPPTGAVDRALRTANVTTITTVTTPSPTAHQRGDAMVTNPSPQVSPGPPSLGTWAKADRILSRLQETGHLPVAQTLQEDLRHGVDLADALAHVCGGLVEAGLTPSAVIRLMIGPHRDQYPAGRALYDWAMER